MSKCNKPQLLFLIVDKDNQIVLDSQRRPTIYRSEEQLKRYKYKFKNTDKICIYNIETEMTVEELEQQIMYEEHKYDEI